MPNEMREVIIKNISYDGDGGEKCPHCKRWIKEPHHWLDHKWTLACAIAKHKGYPECFVKVIEEVLDEVEVTGKPKDDSEIIIKALGEECAKCR